MSTTQLYSGYSEGKPSSRVINPPGGRSNNIFGSDDPPPAPKQQVKEMEKAEGESGDTTTAPPPASAPTHEIYNRNRPKKQDIAPFASFTSSDPNSPFERNGMSQNGNDFRCHSVTAYRDAVILNAEIRNRARGQASAFNPITHEDYDASGEQPDIVIAPQRSAAQIRSEKDFGNKDFGTRGKAKAQAYNPITGEEIPADRNINSSPQVAPTPASTSSHDHSNPQPSTKGTPQPSIPTPDPTSTASPSRNVHTSSKVLKPPGGGSSGPLW